jgi:putative spermidine/putrescine transport system permease protein
MGRLIAWLRSGSLILLAFGLVLPLLFLLLLSVSGQWRYPDILPRDLTWAHWKMAFLAQQGSLLALRNSSLLALVVATISTFAGFFTASVLAYDARRGLWLKMAYLPYVFSPVIYAYGLLFYFHYSNVSGTFGGLLLAQLLLTYPFAVIFFFRHFDGPMQALGQLSQTLGASQWQVYRKVWVPVSATALRICFFQVFLISWFEYGLSSVIGLGQVRTLTLAVYQYIGESNIYFAALASSLLSLPPLLMLWLGSFSRFGPRRGEQL